MIIIAVGSNDINVLRPFVSKILESSMLSGQESCAASFREADAEWPEGAPIATETIGVGIGIGIGIEAADNGLAVTSAGGRHGSLARLRESTPIPSSDSEPEVEGLRFLRTTSPRG